MIILFQAFVFNSFSQQDTNRRNVASDIIIFEGHLYLHRAEWIEIITINTFNAEVSVKKWIDSILVLDTNIVLNEKQLQKWEIINTYLEKEQIPVNIDGVSKEFGQYNVIRYKHYKYMVTTGKLFDLGQELIAPASDKDISTDHQDGFIILKYFERVRGR